MVAISAHRGKLHKVPNIPREWLTPTPSISPKDFKLLLRRRSNALSLLQSSTPSNPNPNQLPHKLDSSPTPPHCDVNAPPNLKLDDKLQSEAASLQELQPPDHNIDNSELVEKVDNLALEISPGASNPNPVPQMDNKEDRKKEIEEKLKVLNAKKHDLVQVLKQIINAEEELKKRSTVQGPTVRPSVSLHVDVTNDSGSMTRHLTPRMGSDGLLRGDGEGGEADDASNHNTHSRSFLRMSSVSPSSDSPHKRPFHTAVPHSSRATPWASASPSRFAPTGQQGNLASVPTVSASGTNYIASSPSPAASGGTSVFRDARHRSPWN
ncbi:hypothetical protein DCAR_0624700 [Daucus carota subsp. sativus]|uniref:Uncharacterized protein n=1 Tax=Daucus carota subsp. sativus TaxID=79200 RepID=A0A164VZT6_DAUCS|nr:PREDICTED: uncharacterized protein LOC108225111 [Daucus carota subsp. sativus]WOH05285.1 hypothetical protein DCAR_0624700 [Daucus carota subsp. sativus]